MKFQVKGLETEVIVQLPSKNIFYGLPQDLRVKVRPMTVKEQKAMLSMNGNNVEDVINSIVFATCRYEDGRPLPQDLLIGDRDFLLNEVRKITYGSDIEFTFTCDKCNTENKVHYDLSMLDTIPIPDDFKLEDLQYTSKYITDEEGNPVVFQFIFPTITTVKQQNILSKNKRDILIYAGIVSNIYGIVTTEVSEDGKVTKTIKQLSLEDKKNLLEVLMQVPAAEVTNMLNFMREHSFDGIQKSVTFTCSNCGSDNDVVIINQDYFFPIRWEKLGDIGKTI